jgi:hypothetical protein
VNLLFPRFEGFREATQSIGLPLSCWPMVMIGKNAEGGREEKPTPFPMGLNFFLEVFMPCGTRQSLLDSEKRIWDAWKRLNDKTNRSASETEEIHRLAGAVLDSSHAVNEHIAVCPECRKADDQTAS